ncbi:MATE family efflux transporter [Draconibacterium sp. IB214405]|uniref:MATE family efflux transporter n=1 Tax=Draconibacterium sp. IB214405 TaxID=3097352 RepID=UPI002A174D60|nr:MATE family efflux transporter [Draconibacterium sp. IB214405]MDX8339236.1 MATE family efflux transporter [Draconibacterium sp. IB214405]
MYEHIIYLYTLMKNIDELQEAHVGRLMLKYFIPAFIGVFVNALYNIVDRIFIGQGVGAEALSGISVIFPIMLIMMGFGMLIGIGTSVYVSINLGKKDMERAEQTLGTSFILMVLASILIMVVTYSLKEPILRSFGSTAETFQYANDYLDIVLGGVAFMVIGFSLNNVIRSEGNAKVAMTSMLLSSITNIILDPIFIFGLDMGVKGAAYATVISMFVLMVWVLYHFIKSKRAVVRLKVKHLTINWEIMLEILAIGMAPFSMQIAGSFVQGLLNKKLIDFGGDLAVGAMGIINSVLTLVIMAIVALNMASQPIIGFNYGAKSVKRIKDTLKITLVAATVIAIVSYALIEAFPGYIIVVFNNDSEVLYDIATRGLRLVILALPIVGFQVVASNFFQAIGKAGLSMFATLFRQVIMLIPLIYILPQFFDIDGIWISYPVADTMSAIVVGIILYREWKRLPLIIESSDEEKN